MKRRFTGQKSDALDTVHWEARGAEIDCSLSTQVHPAQADGHGMQRSSAPLDGVEVGDGDDGADDGDEHDPAGDDAEEEVLERGRDPGLRGLRDLRQHQRRRHGRRGRPLLGRVLRLAAPRGRPDDGRPAGRDDAERRRADAAGAAEGLPEPPGHGQRRRDGGGGHGSWAQHFALVRRWGWLVGWGSGAYV
ncbi:hypothetical protein SETIT_9G408700v2 [Setaria italica]|uniref:Uncharacterized protein n=1 Tax=Setaria italica TaxID=4555 RepID=A0A368SR55_SETIT|nr:hypothetical protein SETIT_9G408700v2 [Setaria italica]